MFIVARFIQVPNPFYDSLIRKSQLLRSLYESHPILPHLQQNLFYIDGIQTVPLNLNYLKITSATKSRTKYLQALGTNQQDKMFQIYQFRPSSAPPPVPQSVPTPRPLSPFSKIREITSAIPAPRNLATWCNETEWCSSKYRSPYRWLSVFASDSVRSPRVRRTPPTTRHPPVASRFQPSLASTENTSPVSSLPVYLTLRRPCCPAPKSLTRNGRSSMVTAPALGRRDGSPLSPWRGLHWCNPRVRASVLFGCDRTDWHPCIDCKLCSAVSSIRWTCTHWKLILL